MAIEYYEASIAKWLRLYETWPVDWTFDVMKRCGFCKEFKDSNPEMSCKNCQLFDMDCIGNAGEVGLMAEMKKAVDRGDRAEWQTLVLRFLARMAEYRGRFESVKATTEKKPAEETELVVGEMYIITGNYGKSHGADIRIGDPVICTGNVDMCGQPEFHTGSIEDDPNRGWGSGNWIWSVDGCLPQGQYIFRDCFRLMTEDDYTVDPPFEIGDWVWDTKHNQPGIVMCLHAGGFADIHFGYLTEDKSGYEEDKIGWANDYDDIRRWVIPIEKLRPFDEATDCVMDPPEFEVGDFVAFPHDGKEECGIVSEVRTDGPCPMTVHPGCFKDDNESGEYWVHESQIDYCGITDGACGKHLDFDEARKTSIEAESVEDPPEIETGDIVELTRGIVHESKSHLIGKRARVFTLDSVIFWLDFGDGYRPNASCMNGVETSRGLWGVRGDVIRLYRKAHEFKPGDRITVHSDAKTKKQYGYPIWKKDKIGIAKKTSEEGNHSWVGSDLNCWVHHPDDCYHVLPGEEVDGMWRPWSDPETGEATARWYEAQTKKPAPELKSGGCSVCGILFRDAMDRYRSVSVSNGKWQCAKCHPTKPAAKRARVNVGDTVYFIHHDILSTVKQIYPHGIIELECMESVQESRILCVGDRVRLRKKLGEKYIGRIEKFVPGIFPSAMCTDAVFHHCSDLRRVKDGDDE